MTKHHSDDSTIDGAHSHEHVHDHISRRSFLSVIPGSIPRCRLSHRGQKILRSASGECLNRPSARGLPNPLRESPPQARRLPDCFPSTPRVFPPRPSQCRRSVLDSLTAEQRAKTMFTVDDPEWRKWMNQHFYMRQGVSFKEMTNAQREAAFGLMRASLSARGMELTRNIMRLNETLAELTNDHEFMGEWMYFITIMGKPSATEPWGWQFDGHHAIINYFVLGDQVVMTPHFAGSEPVLATSGKYKGTVILQEEQAQGLAMAQALTEAQRKKAVLEFSKTGNNNLTEAFKDNVVLDYAGVRVSELSARQNRQMIELVNLFISNMDTGHARVKMDEVKRHLDKTCFAWIGGTEAESTFYYRIHSPVVLVEFDHQRPANLSRFSADPKQPTRQHIHVVVRTPNGNDYGKDLLRQHYLAHRHKS